MGMDIFDSCDQGTETVDLSKLEIDKNFARRLEHNKKREALHRLEQLKKQGRAGASDDSDDSDEDEDDDDVDLGVSSKEELEYIRALNIIKKKDPILKDQDLKLFPSVEEEDENKPVVARKDKPLYLKDVNARHLLDHGPEFEDEPLKHDSKIYKKEQAASIREFMEAEKAAFGEGGDEDFLKQKEKDGGEADGVDVAEIEEGLDEFFGKDDDLDENEKFLKEYLREKKWVDREKGREISVDVDVSEDENELERQDQYEASFNFRYQEPDQEDRVLGHSRVTDGSVRKKTSSRKAQRKSKEERMAQAEFERKEELKHLKNLKKKEIQEKLEKIRAIAGIGNGGNCKLDAEDLEEDFDPEEYDQKMREMFGLEYYGEEDVDPGFGSDADNMEKPDFDKEDELLGLAKGWEVSGSKDGFAATREKVLKQKEKEEELMEEPQKEEGKRKRKRKISLKEKVELDKELEEYYKLDYEDTIGDLKTRFKYRTVEANKYDLRPEEILMADDKDLNQYVSLKKLAPYREEEWKVTTHQKKKKSLILQGDPSKISKKHTRNGGQSSLKAEMNSRTEPNDISRRARRRHRLAELKPTWERLRAYGKIQSKPQKHR